MCLNCVCNAALDKANVSILDIFTRKAIHKIFNLGLQPISIIIFILNFLFKLVEPLLFQDTTQLGAGSVKSEHLYSPGLSACLNYCAALIRGFIIEFLYIVLFA